MARVCCCISSPRWIWRWSKSYSSMDSVGRWMHVIPIEGLLERVVGDVLIHYLNVVGAYIVCATVLAVALYLSTAFSFAAIQVWAPTRFAFVTALWNRYKD